MYKVEADPVTNMVRHTLAGFFEPMDVKNYVAARNVAHMQLTSAPNQHVTLVDIRDMKIQQQDVVKTFGGVLADPRYHSRKLAFVVALSLARMQLLRASANRNAQYFDNIEEAETWLLADDDQHETADPGPAALNKRVA